MMKRVAILLLLCSCCCCWASSLVSTYDVSSSTFSLLSYTGSNDNFSRTARSAREHAPSGAAVFGNSTDRLLSTSLSASGSAELCEWSLSSMSSGPLRCTMLVAASSHAPRDLVYMPHPTYPYVLVAISEDNTVLAVDYSTFQVDQDAWFSLEDDTLNFLGPTALEYDPSTDMVYVALERSDCIMRLHSSGSLVDPAGQCWTMLPRPRFLILDTNQQPASLYVLTADFTLPELYRLRLSDGASISTVANLDGSWWPEEAPTDDSIRSVTLQNGTLYTLWEHSDSIVAYNLRTAEALDQLPSDQLQQLQGDLLDPVSLVRDETRGATLIQAVVDVKAWYSTNISNATAANRLQYFESCTPGVASGATLDGASVLRVLSCPSPNANSTDPPTLLVADIRSVYRLVARQHYAGGVNDTEISTRQLCFDGYVVSPTLGWNITDMALEPDSDELLVSTLDNWRVRRLLATCESSLAPATEDLNATTLLRQPPCAAGAFCTHYSPAERVMCQLSFASNAALQCTNGVYTNLHLDLTSAVGAGWDSEQELLWVGLRNGSALSWDNTLTLLGSDDVFDASNHSFVGFAIDISSSGPIWALVSDSSSSSTGMPTYLYTTSTFPPSFVVVSSLARSQQQQRQSLTPPLKVSGVWSRPYVSPLAPVPHVIKDSAALVAMICLTIFFAFMLGVVICICLRQRRKQQQQYVLAGVEAGVNPPHIRAWKPFRNFVRRLLCCCDFCYDDFGYVRCCYYCLGGGSERTMEARARKNGGRIGEEMHSLNASYIIEDEQEQRKAREAAEAELAAKGAAAPPVPPGAPAAAPITEEAAQAAALQRPPPSEPYSRPVGAADADQFVPLSY